MIYKNFTEDEDLLAEYIYEYGKIPRILQMDARQTRAVKAAMKVIPVLAVIVVILFFFSKYWESSMELQGMYGTYLLIYPKASIIILSTLIISELLLAGWLKAVGRLDELAFQRASQRNLAYGRWKIEEEKKQLNRIFPDRRS